MSEIDKILHPLVSGWKSWVHDQLDGTGNLDDALREISFVQNRTEQELRSLIEEMMKEVVGTSPKNPYGTKDVFFHEWGAQAAKYDEFVRDCQRQRIPQVLDKYMGSNSNER